MKLRQRSNKVGKMVGKFKANSIMTMMKTLKNISRFSHKSQRIPKIMVKTNRMKMIKMRKIQNTRQILELIYSKTSVKRDYLSLSKNWLIERIQKRWKNKKNQIKSNQKTKNLRHPKLMPKMVAIPCHIQCYGVVHLTY